jgi:hypothetical protein
VLAKNLPTGFTYGPPPLPKPVFNKSSVPGDATDTLKRQLTAKAGDGDANVQLTLGKLYEFGTLRADGGARPDYAGAAYWYDQAAQKGLPEAAYRLGLLFLGGKGVPADAFRSRQLLAQAGDGGMVPAMVELANVYLELKLGYALSRAAYWAAKAGNTGDPEGLNLQGYLSYKADRPRALLDNGYQLALGYWKKAADLGHCAAMMNVGGLYFNGQGVPQDAAQAEAWFAKAANCQRSDMAWVRQRAEEFRNKAAKGQVPVKVPAASTSNGGIDGEKALAGLMALVALSGAQDVIRDNIAEADRSTGSAGSSSRNSSSPIGSGSRTTTSAPTRTCRQVSVDNSFSTPNGKGLISPRGATTLVCD